MTKTPGKIFSLRVLIKRDFSDPLGVCRKGLSLAGYATDIEVIMKEAI